MKRIILSVLMLMILFSGVVLADGQIAVVVDGDQVYFEDQNPVIIEDRTLVPVRKTMENLGLIVSWYKNEQKVICEKEDKKIELYINNKTAKVDGKDIQLDVPAQIINGRTMVPLRFITESCNMTVNYKADIKCIIIESEEFKQINPQYKSNLTHIYKDGKHGCIDRDGKVVIDIKYDAFSIFHDGLAQVMLDGNFGFINEQGNEVVKIKYSSLGFFSEGLALATLNGKWGAVDKEGKVVIDIKYDSMKAFSGGVSEVELNGRMFYINKEGNQVINDKTSSASNEIKVISATPWNGDDTVSDDLDKISINYINWSNSDYKIDIDYNKIKALDENGNSIIDGYNIDNSGVHCVNLIVKKGTLKPGKTYTVNLPAVVSTDGAISNPYTLSFTTQIITNNGTKVVKTTPIDGATGVSTNGDIIIEYNKDINASSTLSAATGLYDITDPSSDGFLTVVTSTFDGTIEGKRIVYHNLLNILKSGRTYEFNVRGLGNNIEDCKIIFTTK